MIPRDHPLASVREAYNAVFVESEAAGQLMFYGAGRRRRADRERGARRPRVAPARNRVRRRARASASRRYAELRGAADGRDA